MPEPPRAVEPQLDLDAISAVDREVNPAGSAPPIAQWKIVTAASAARPRWLATEGQTGTAGRPQAPAPAIAAAARRFRFVFDQKTWTRSGTSPRARENWSAQARRVRGQERGTLGEFRERAAEMREIGKRGRLNQPVAVGVADG
ncbi:hypothetical protein [Actinomadura geliboluensis]|uniref:hypothetical protein n=1 Tax=Actinomadura geliboluensis TaxID=882440 RepID=UPI00263A2B1A|nr:hypothetical protein [Actinomadura geliboluensis]